MCYLLSVDYFYLEDKEDEFFLFSSFSPWVHPYELNGRFSSPFISQEDREKIARRPRAARALSWRQDLTTLVTGTCHKLHRLPLLKTKIRGNHLTLAVGLGLDRRKNFLTVSDRCWIIK